MTDWDYKMQIECAKSFIAPIKMNVRKREMTIVTVNRAEEHAEDTQIRYRDLGQ